MSLLDNYIPISEYLSEEIGAKIAEIENKYGDIVTYADSGSTCSSCQGSCTGGCTGSCQSTCTGGCSGSCSGTCRGTCTGTCTGTCSSSCTGTCAKTCTGTCENYCKDTCQTYCQYQQTYSKNNGSNKPSGSGTIFTWDPTPVAGDTIAITATDWNKLGSYVKAAAPYCYGSSIATRTQVAKNDPITAAIYNNLKDGVDKIGSSGKADKETNVSIVKADDFTALSNGYNNAKILSSLPSNSSGAANKCCQKGMISPSTWGSNQTCPQTPGSSL